MEMRINEAAIVVSFEQDNFVRLKQSKAEEAYKKITDKPSVNTNAADTQNPAAPRILIKDSLKGIAVSQVSAQLAMLFDKKEDLNGQVQSVMENIDLMFNATKEFQGEQNIKDTGILVTLTVPSASGASLNELNGHIFKTYSKFEPLGDVVSAFYKIGFKTDNGLFLGIDLGTYELPAAAADAGGKRQGGYIVRVDLNNKPAAAALDASKNSASAVPVSPGEIKTKFKSFIDKDMAKFFKKGLS